MLQHDGQLEVGAKGSADSPGPHEHFTFGLSVTVNEAADAQSSQSASPNSTSSYNSLIQHCLCIQVTLREGEGLNP